MTFLHWDHPKCRLLGSLYLVFYCIVLVEAMGLSEEETVYRTYYIVYQGDNGHNLLNCSAPPGNHSGEITHIKWEPPSGVTLVSDIDTMMTVEHKTEDGAVENPSAWVELTNDHQLQFHQPDLSVRGPYMCQSMQDLHVLYTTVVWVHVMDKYVFDLGHRFLVGFIAAGIFIVSILAYVFFHERNSGYTVADMEDISLQNRADKSDI